MPGGHLLPRCQGCQTSAGLPHRVHPHGMAMSPLQMDGAASPEPCRWWVSVTRECLGTWIRPVLSGDALPSTTVTAVPCRVQQTQGRGSTSTSDREAPRAAKFLISIIKACSFLPVDVPSKSLHQRSHLCEELHRLQEAYVSGLIVQSHVATADTLTQLSPDTSHCHRWRIQCWRG